ncbi:MAG TPA: Gldg family protein [Candidatus Acidoferrales bacterium]
MKWDRQETLRFIGTLGLALLVGGYLRYTVQGELLLTSKILMIAGGAIFVIALAFGFREVVGFFSGRSARLGTNVATLVISVIFILGFLNFLGYRHHKRFDLTSEKLYTLSDQSKRVVSGLKQNVEIIRFGKTPDQELRDRFKEFTSLSPRLQFTEVDPEEKPQMAKQYGVTRMNQVVVTSNGHNEILQNTDEQDITNAIVKVTRNTVKTVCFVTGHGEKSIDGSEEEGFSGMNDALKKESYQTKSVNLVSEGNVPADCNVLVVAGPKQAFFPQEAEMIGKYLDAGGDVLLMIDPQTDPKLDNVLSAWNINLGQNVVVDASGVGRLFGTGPAVPLVVDYGESPITRSFNGSMTFFPLARTVSIADKNKSVPEDVELLKTSARSFTIPNLNVKEVQFDPKTAGPLSLGVSAERKNPPGDNSAKGGHLVVIGNSEFAANKWAGLQRNGDLFMNTVNWLAQDVDLISIRPKSPTNRRVTFTETQQRELTWFSLLLLPGLVILSGVYIWWKRR